MYVPDPSQIKVAVEIGVTLAKQQKPVARWFGRARRTWLRSHPGPERILIAGQGGAGKTTLFQLLTGDGSLISATYRQTNIIQRKGYVGDVFGDICCLPGQGNPFDLSAPSPSVDRIERSFPNLTGLILVSAFGYDTLSEIPNVTPDALRQQRLYEEDQIIESLCSISGRFASLRWIALVINKRDFWIGEEVSCFQRYRNVDSIIRSSFQRAGRGGQISSAVVGTSLISSNVRRADNSIFFKIDSEYDDVVRKFDVNTLIFKLDELASGRT